MSSLEAKSKKKSFLFNKNLTLVPILVVIFIAGAFINPAFLTLNNLLNNILTTSAVLGVLVIGEAIILIGGFFDLSLQSVVGFGPMLFAVLISPKTNDLLNGNLGYALPGYVGFLITLAVIVAIGAINGFMVAKMKLNAFIVTLAMLILIQGFTLGISGGQTYSGLPDYLTFLGSARFLDIPIQAIIFVVLFAAVYIFMKYTVTGRNIYAMGGNLNAAKAAGINVSKLTIGIFISGGVFALLSGLMLTGRIASVTANQGDGLIFTVFAASVIGGISLDGGRGNMIGAGIGVLLLGVIQNILTLSNVPSFWINAAYGAIILGALLVGWISSRNRTSTRSGKG